MMKTTQSQFVRLFVVFLTLQSPSSWADSFNRNHYCYDSTHAQSKICATWHAIKSPSFSSTSDRNIVIAPHRGVWGTDTGGGPGSGPPENSLTAVQAAATQQYSIVEMDVMLAKDQQIVCSHDYPLFRTTNIANGDAPDAYVFDQNLAYLEQLRLKRRNGSVSDQKFLTGGGLITAASQYNLGLLIDPKEPIGKFVHGQCVEFCDNEYFKKTGWLNTVTAILQESTKQNAQQFVAVKTMLTPDEILNGVTEKDPNTGETRHANGLGLTLMTEVLWVPIVISSHYQNDINKIIDYISLWTEKADYSGILAYVETDFISFSDVMLKPFTVGQQEYSNILDRLRLANGLRGGLFSEEPVSSRGIFTRWGVGKMKDSAHDRRADIFGLLSHDYSGYMVITSDRPDVWRQFNP